LKLTPTAADDDIGALFDPLVDHPAPPESADGTPLAPPLDHDEPDDDLERALHIEIEFLGIDTVALLPPARIDEVVVAVEAGDLRRARTIVHRSARAAARKLARRLLSNKPLRSRADRFIQRQTARLREAVRVGQTRAAIAEILSSRSGRAYLIFDAAVGDLR
jgi:hypothetical protein